jgi:Carboxypeptidase regulatory-like domain
VQRSQVKIAILAIVLTAAATGRAAGPVAAVSGVVRDAQGVAQMGALVQVLANDAMVGTAFTDLHGRYLIANLVPGKYEVRASAALFVPTLRENLQLRPGAKAVVNLTLNAIFDAASWLPAERRKADEPSDDWTWTLRSAANRPILRMVEDGQMVMISSSATETRTVPDRVRAAMTSGDGGFGTGGIHNVFSLA